MLLKSSVHCNRMFTDGFYKNVNSDDLLLHNQIVFYWNVSSARNYTISSKAHRSYNRVVCPGVSIRPAGRYVRNFLMDGAVYFWLLHVRASIECPSRQTPSEENFQLRLTQWIDNSESGGSQKDADEAYERGDPYLGGYDEPENLTLSCAQPQRSVILQGRLRKLVVSWDIFPDRFPKQSRNDSTQPPDDLIDSFKDLPDDLRMRIQVTSRLHYDGRFSINRRRELCGYYGFWCNGSMVEEEEEPTQIPSQLRSRRLRRSDSGDELTGTCIRTSMRCDGLPDCWPDDPENSPDEMGCNVVLRVEDGDGLSPFESFNESSPNASSSSTGRGQSWTSKLPWMVVAFVPAVLLCALVRICSQRRQLDFATIDGDLHALESRGACYSNGSSLECHLRRPQSLPNFDNKKSLSNHGRNILAIALRRSRSTEDVVSPGDNLALKSIKPLTIGNYSHPLHSEGSRKEECGVEMTLTPQVTTRKPKSAGAVVNRMIMSCWSGDFSVSSSSSSATYSPVSRRVIEASAAAEAEAQVASGGDGGVDDCDVCRQMRESMMVGLGEENPTQEAATGRPNESDSSGSGASTPSTTSTSGFGQHEQSLERPAKGVSRPVVRESRENGIEMTVTRQSRRDVSEDPLLDALNERRSQYENPLQSTNDEHDHVS